MSYLDDVPGVKDIRLRGGAILPRRNAVEIDGAEVSDVTASGETRIVLKPLFKLQPVYVSSLAASEDAALLAVTNTDADSYRFLGITGAIGLGGPRNGGRLKIWLFNGDPVLGLTIYHEHAGANAAQRFVTPDASDLVLAAGQIALATYFSSRWRIVG